ncbi:stage III sporulation protein AE [Zongyangia hominis]|uniref:Stage III sporulation protein AE n=1 Tax=Zongyangia hominis TaxID=2763677 RepID=A0A926ECV0_9FIRM|nr:stage III sporulation protein AE [Zongyangia hominis]MBC8569606.1 stage III sporulation protein AE [Zongyangia hominis]
MKKILLFLLVLVLLTVPVHAASSGESQSQSPDIQEQFDEQLQSSGADELIENAPEEVKESLYDLGLDTISFQKILSLSPKEFLPFFVDQIKGIVVRPIKLLAIVVGIIVLCALMNTLKQSIAKNRLNEVFHVVSILCICAAVITPVIDCISKTGKTIFDCSNFLISFVPVLSGVMTAGGQIVTSTSYQIFLFWAAEIVSVLVSRTLVPFLGIYLAIAIVASINPEFQLYKIADSIKSFVCWALGGLLTVFVGILSIQGIVASSADTVSLKATKFLISSVIPVVGGALSDALGSVQSCVKLLKTSVGAYGIIIAVLTFLPLLIESVSWLLVTKVSQIVADFLGVEGIAPVLKATSSVISIILSIILCFMMLIIITTTIMMMLGTGG